MEQPHEEGVELLYSVLESVLVEVTLHDDGGSMEAVHVEACSASHASLLYWLKCM